jgi:hypothetical protein
MTNQINALLVDSVEGAALTDDKQHLLLKLHCDPEGELTLAVPVKLSAQLVDLAALGIPNAAKLPTGEGTAAAFDVTWWELRLVVGSTDAVLSLTLANGGVLSFRVDQTMQRAIQETLSAHSGQSTGQPPETSLQ